MKNLLEPTPAQIKYRNKLWANALIENKRKATGQMYKDGGRCCLAVAQDVAKSCGVEYEDIDDKLPTPNTMKFFGWDDMNPDLLLPSGDEDGYAAACLNDGGDSMVKKFNKRGQLTHKQIAECVMNTFVHPKKQVWNLVKEK